MSSSSPDLCHVRTRWKALDQILTVSSWSWTSRPSELLKRSMAISEQTKNLKTSDFFFLLLLLLLLNWLTPIYMLFLAAKISLGHSALLRKYAENDYYFRQTFNCSQIIYDTAGQSHSNLTWEQVYVTQWFMEWEFWVLCGTNLIWNIQMSVLYCHSSFLSLPVPGGMWFREQLLLSQPQIITLVKGMTCLAFQGRLPGEEKLHGFGWEQCIRPVSWVL